MIRASGTGRPAKGAAAGPLVQVFPVVIGHYRDPGWPDLDVEAEAGRVLDLLAPFGARPHRWACPARERGADAVQRRLRQWADSAGRPGTPASTVLYWAGHGWSDGARAALAHAGSPNPIGGFGVTPEQFAGAIRARQASLRTRTGEDVGDGKGWALVVIDTCKSGRFAELLVAALHDPGPPPRGVMLAGVSGDGATTLGRFTEALRTALHATFKADSPIMLTDLARQLQRLGDDGWVVRDTGGLADAALAPVSPSAASSISGPLDVIRHLEDVLAELSPDERQHFLVKAQGAEHGEMSWFFEGRDRERAQITTWLRDARSGMFTLTGRAGSGKSALLGNVLVHSLPGLRSALARRGLVTALAPGTTPPDRVFDAVIHLSGLTLTQVTGRLAAAARLGSPPSHGNPDTGVALELDWLAARLAERSEPFTVLVDALDEAAEPLGIARTLLARIAGLPGVRVLVGTRASTNEAPDAPTADQNLLDALGSGRALPGHGEHARPVGGCRRSGLVWLGGDPEAIRRFVAGRLRAARDHGVAGRAVPYLTDVGDDDVERAAAEVAGRGRGFLFARLAVYELIASPRLLTRGRADSLDRLLSGDHRNLFARALRRLAEHDDRYGALLEALSLARGRGMPEADGIWATTGAALYGRSRAGAARTAGADDGWAQAISSLLNHAAPYITVGTNAAGSVSADATGTPGSHRGHGGPQTVYRLAHRTFAEYYTGRAHAAGASRSAATALLGVAGRIAAAGPARMPAYLASHLSGHAADTGLWDDLAALPSVLDCLDPYAVTADAIRTLFGRRTLPPTVAGIIGARDALARAAPADRPGLRQLATAVYSSEHVIGEPVTGWAVAAARAGRASIHVRLSGHTAPVAKLCSFTLPDRRTLLASAGDDGTIRLWDPGTGVPAGAPLTGHTGAVHDICVLSGPTGQALLVTAADDATVRIWDPVTGQQAGAPLTGHTGAVWGVCAFHQDQGGGAERLLASVGDDATLRVWDPLTGQQLGGLLTGHTGGVYVVRAVPGRDLDGRPDGRTLLVTAGLDGTVGIWDAATGRQVRRIPTGHLGGIWTMCTVPGHDSHGRLDGRNLLATTGGEGTIRFCDPVTGQQVYGALTAHAGYVMGLCTLRGRDGDGCPDGPALLASGGDDGAIRVWDYVTGQAVREDLTGHRGGVCGLCTVHGGAGDTRRDGRTLLASGGRDGTVRIWDPAGPPTEQGAAGRSGMAAVCALPGWDHDGLADGRALLASAGRDGTVRIWDPAAGQIAGDALAGHTDNLHVVCAVPVSCADSVPAGQTLLATAGDDGTARIWNPITGRQIGDPLTGHAGSVLAMSTLPGYGPGGRRDGRTLLATTGDDAVIRVWDPVTGQQAGTVLTSHSGSVRGMCSLPGWDGDGRPDGRTLLATAGDDGTVRVWDPGTGRPVGEAMTGHTAGINRVCTLPGWDADGRPDARTLLATSGRDGTARIWDPAAGRATGQPLTGHAGRVWGVCTLPGWDADGRPDERRTLLATTGADGTVRIWDPVAGCAVGEPLTGHAGRVWGLCTLPGLNSGCSGERTLLATAGEDGTLRVWDPVTGRAVGEPLAGSPDTVAGLAACTSPVADCLTMHADGAVQAWTAATASLRAVASARNVSAIATLPSHDGVRLVTGDTSGQVHLSDLTEPRDRPMPFWQGQSAVLAMCPVPGKTTRIAAACGAGTIHVLALTAGHGAVGTVLRGHCGTVRGLCVIERADGPPLLASAGNDATIRVWDLRTQAPHGAPLTGHDGWIWSVTAIPARPGHPPRLASAGADHTVRLWDPFSCSPIGEPLTGHTGQVRAVIIATSSDGRALLVSGGHDGTVRLWHPETGTPMRTIPLGIPIHALLQQSPDPQLDQRTQRGATITVGLRGGILALGLHSSLFPAGAEQGMDS